MPQFQYTALSRGGEKVTGVVEGFNELDAASRVKEQCDVILKLAEVKDREESGGILSMQIGGEKLNRKAFVVMCSQFAIILKSGVPIVRTVNLIADKTVDKPLQKLLKKVGADVEGGRSLSAAFEAHGKKLLPPTFIETLRAGEESGNLDRSFDTMQKHFDKQMKMGKKVQGAMAYPIFVLFIAVVVVIVLMVKVVPTFLTIFDTYDAELPLPTRMLIGISNFFQRYIIHLVVIAAAATAFYQAFSHTETGRMTLAKLALKVPILGNIAELNAASQFANSMTTLLDSGLTMTKAVSITSRTLDNYYISTEVGKLAGKLEEGRTLGASMREAQCLPDILIDMTAVGEETGELTATLDTIALYYDTELEQAIQDALAKLEPALLVGLAGIAGFIVIAIYMSMFSMYSSM